MNMHERACTCIFLLRRVTALRVRWFVSVSVLAVALSLHFHMTISDTNRISRVYLCVDTPHKKKILL